MTGNRISIIAAAAAILIVASCAHDPFAGRGIRFQAHSTGFAGKAPSTNPETKTTYGDDAGSAQIIEWSKGDIIRIASDKAYVLDDPDRKWSDFKVSDQTVEGAVSKATITPSSDPNSLQWGDGKHKFWAMYPTPALVTGASFTDGTMVFPMPAAQPMVPDMKYAPMLAYKSDVSEGAVPLAFTPQFNVFEFTVDKSVYEEINLTSFSLTAETGTIAGIYTVAEGSYAAVESITSGSQTITMDLTGTTLNEQNKTVTITVFTIPDAPTISPGIKGLQGLTIEFQGSFDGDDQTRRLTLKDAEGEKLVFPPYKKYRIYGLSFPLFVPTTLENISWDFGVEILDGIVWWMNADMHNHIYWTTDINMDAYANLPDEVKWFTTTSINRDFAWEEFRNIALDDESDMYLWKGQTGSRTVSAFNRSGYAYLDYTLEWSVEQTDKVISLNGTTGEITAKNPGMAIVKATATPGDGSTPQTVSYKVYVNAPTGITLTAAKNFVKPSGTVGLTATLTCTSNGTIPEYPADMLEWSSANTTYITLSDEESQPAAATGQATATATGGASEGTSTLTVSVAAKYADGISASLTDFPCEDRTEIDLLTYGGEKYKFRNLSLSPGILKYVGSSATDPSGYTLTDGSDPLELLKHYYHDNNGGEGLNVYYHVWAGTNSLADRLMHSTSTSYDSEITQTITIGGTTWRIPSGGADDREWDLIINDTHKKDITINTVGYPKNSSATGNYIRVVVDLTGANDGNAYDYSSHGLTNATISTSGGKQYVSAIASPSDHLAGTFGYQAGVLLIPDGAIISCGRINSVPGLFYSSSYGNTNLITFSDLIILTEGGCVFLPAAGFYSSYSSHNFWNDGGKDGYYWSRNPNSGSTPSYFLHFQNNYIYTTYSSRGKDNSLFPVKLVHD